MHLFDRIATKAAPWVIAAAVLLHPVAAHAEEFFKDKTISLMVGTEPGGSYDLYARLIAAHLARHIPGRPSINVEFMPGAGGATAGNYIYGIGPQDGTKVLLSHALPMIEKLQGGGGTRYASNKLQWIGAYDSISMVMALWHTAPAKTVDDLRNANLAIGAMARNHVVTQSTALVKYALDAGYRMIPGYRSGNELNVAMERGEIQGLMLSWENLTGTRPQWIKDKTIAIPLQFALDRIPELSTVPTLLELTPPERKPIVDFILSGMPTARGVVVGPGVPADRTAILRKAFDDLMKDETFLAEATKRKLSISPRNAQQMQALVEKITSASPEVVTQVKKAIGMEQ
jgi:tripartite-type tricarboxylate transporter receptor subunit TctC